MKDTTTAKAELASDLDIAIHDATVELLDGRLHILADRFGITLDAAVVQAIRDEFNLEYAVAPRDRESLYVTRISDGVHATVVRRSRHLYEARITGNFDGPVFAGTSPVAAAKAAFVDDDALQAAACSAVSV